MSFSILVVDDEPDIADLFRQHFRRESRQGTYVLHFAGSGEEALQLMRRLQTFPPSPRNGQGSIQSGRSAL